MGQPRHGALTEVVMAELGCKPTPWVQRLCSSCSRCDLSFLFPLSFPFPQHTELLTLHLSVPTLKPCAVSSASSVIFSVKPHRPPPPPCGIRQHLLCSFCIHSVHTHCGWLWTGGPSCRGRVPRRLSHPWMPNVWSGPSSSLGIMVGVPAMAQQ